MAPRSLFYCGRQISFPLAELSRVAIWLIWNSPNYSGILFDRDGVQMAADLWLLIGEPTPCSNLLSGRVYETEDHSMTSLMRLSRYRKCSEPKDRIFAIIGIALQYYKKNQDENIDPSLLTVDYAKDWSKILGDATRFAIQQSRDLDILTSVIHRTDGPLSSDMMPSWIPRIDTDPDDQDSMRFVLVLFNADAGQPLDIFCAQRDYLGPEVLALHGLNVDRITHVSEVISDSVLEDAYKFAALLNYILDIYRDRDNHELHLESNNDMLQDETHRHLVSTLMAGSNAGISPAVATETDIDAMQAYLGGLIKGEEYADFGAGPETQRNILDESCRNRRFFKTSTGSIGLGPRCTQTSDTVLILAGSAVPFIARRLCGSNDDLRFYLLGEAYVHGIMNGEAVKAARENGISFSVFNFY